MQIRTHVSPGNHTFSISELSIEEMSMLKRALITTWDDKNFNSDQQEALCEELIDKFCTVL